MCTEGVGGGVLYRQGSHCIVNRGYIWSYSLVSYPQCIATYRGWGGGGLIISRGGYKPNFWRVKNPLQRVNGNAARHIANFTYTVKGVKIYSTKQRTRITSCDNSTG